MGENSRANEDIPKRLEKEEINELPLIRFHGAIKFAEDSKSFLRLAEKLRKQRVLGFDIECKPNFKRGPNNPPALIQLATSDQAFLFRLYPIMKLGPLVKILEDPKIIKTGVAIKDDLHNLQKIESFTPAGFEDLAPLAQSLKIEQTGLRNLTAIFLSNASPNRLSYQTGKKDRFLLRKLITQPRMLGLAESSISL